MKKIFTVLLLLGILISYQAKADTAYFFQDGKGYSVDGQQEYFRFLDGSCYNLAGVYQASCSIAVVPAPSIIQTSNIDPLLNNQVEALPHLDPTGIIIDNNLLNFTCKNDLIGNYTNQISCTNNTGFTATVKEVLLDNIPISNADPDTITNSVAFYTSSNINIPFTSSSTNTYTWVNSQQQLLARIALPIEPVTISSVPAVETAIPNIVLNTVGANIEILSDTVLVNINNQDILYKVGW